MEKLVQFVDIKGESLFSAVVDVMPLKGDKVSYSMEAKFREDWNEDSWDHSHVISGKRWVVDQIHHQFRCLSISRTVPVVIVNLIPDQDP